ncbi:flavodoxin domain-containing protein [Rubellicoccus peritrichatus]|uniref:Flavodoxin domain-containing protein n=1 Tax=Rubellicoccus peritrichatus TaxID=3080537 RepID=A0AAQ3QVA9_9BACT|nr:flavodoxin domain-containing protein [Puniceicoccus sp. CR14]WOO41388.1 flavodoxin domain-containing protein [Puniceicoccus sp. CR14]
MHIIFGTMTGNAEDLADRFAKRCEQENLPYSLTSADNWPMEKFQSAKRAVLIFSTWGEGEPPDDAIDFCESVYDQKAEVAHLEYAVVGLGDTSYDDFCGCARRLDESLKAAGATPFSERLELDIDFDDDFDAWTDKFFSSQKVLSQSHQG